MSHLKQTDIVIDFWIPTTHCQYLPHSTESLRTAEHFNYLFELWLSWKLLSTNHIPTLFTLLLHLYLLRSVMCYFQQSHTTWLHKLPTHVFITRQVYYIEDIRLDTLSHVDQKVQMATEVCDRIAITPIHHFFCSSTSKLQTANQERRPQEISELNIGANLVATLCGVALQIHLV